MRAPWYERVYRELHAADYPAFLRIWGVLGAVYWAECKIREMEVFV